MRLALVAIGLVFGCSGSGTGDAPCEVAQVASCPTCGTGQLLRALRGTAGVASSSPSANIVCAACASLWSVGSGAPAPIATFEQGTRTGLAMTAAAPDGALYVVADDGPPPAPPDSIGYVPPPPTDVVLFALDGSGATRWTLPLDSVPLRLVADDTGPTLFAAGAASPVPTLGNYTATALAAADGGMRWTASLTGPAGLGGAIIADGSGGLYVVTTGGLDSAGTVSSQLSHVAPGGDVDGSGHQMTTTNPTPAIENMGTMMIPMAAAVTADGGELVTGWLIGDDLELGDMTLTANGNTEETGFVVSFDAAGATRWARVFGIGDPQWWTVIARGDDAVISGAFQGTSSDLPLTPVQNANVAVVEVGSAGIGTVIEVGGSGTKYPGSLFAVGSASVWLDVFCATGYNNEPSQLQVGTTTIDDAGTTNYVLELGL